MLTAYTFIHINEKTRKLIYNITNDMYTKTKHYINKITKYNKNHQMQQKSPKHTKSNRELSVSSDDHHQAKNEQ